MPGIDLHVHSTASDGQQCPAEVARRAAAAGLDAFALTDHDTLAGVAEAARCGVDWGIAVVPGCEFSVAVAWGEMHLLGYYLPLGDPDLEPFLAEQRRRRAARAEDIVRRLQELGVAVTAAHVLRAAGGGAVGRPHVARALVERGAARDVQQAFDRYLAAGRPAYVAKDLPELSEVVEVVRAAGGVTSAAHLNERGSLAELENLKRAGVDAIEVVHPAHDARTRRRLRRHAAHLGLLSTGGSDWHGDDLLRDGRAPLGGLTIPAAWVRDLRALHQRRARAGILP